MNILYPAMLWFLALIPALALLHLLKPKPKLEDVANLFTRCRYRRLRLDENATMRQACLEGWIALIGETLGDGNRGDSPHFAARML